MTTGADLVAAIRRRAAELGVPVTRFAAPLSGNPQTWLSQTERALAPKPHTVARVEALLAGRPVPPPPANNFQLAPPAPNAWTGHDPRAEKPALRADQIARRRAEAEAARAAHEARWLAAERARYPGLAHRLTPLSAQPA